MSDSTMKLAEELIQELGNKLKAAEKQLAERDALLREALEYWDDGVGRCDSEWVLLRKLHGALSASAEPKCQDGGMCGDSSHKCTGCAPVAVISVDPALQQVGVVDVVEDGYSTCYTGIMFAQAILDGTIKEGDKLYVIKESE